MLSAENLTQLLTSLIPILGHHGFQILEIEENHVRTFMPLEPNHNHLNSVYAGSLVAMAEATGGALLASLPDFADYKLMVKNISIEYHRLALTAIHCDLRLPEDFRAVVDGQLAAEGKAFYEMPVEIYDGADVCVATARLNYRVKRNS